VADGMHQSFGEIEPERKHAISHRSRAFAMFKAACLDGLPKVEPKTQSGRDAEGFMAAARNLSSREELVSFIANLRKDHAMHGRAWGPQSLSEFLTALETELAAVEIEEKEPHWRVVAKALFAASR